MVETIYWDCFERTAAVAATAAACQHIVVSLYRISNFYRFLLSCKENTYYVINTHTQYFFILSFQLPASIARIAFSQHDWDECILLENVQQQKWQQHHHHHDLSNRTKLPLWPTLSHCVEKRLLCCWVPLQSFRKYICVYIIFSILTFYLFTL